MDELTFHVAYDPSERAASPEVRALVEAAVAVELDGWERTDRFRAEHEVLVFVGPDDRAPGTATSPIGRSFLVNGTDDLDTAGFYVGPLSGGAADAAVGSALRAALREWRRGQEPARPAAPVDLNLDLEAVATLWRLAGGAVPMGDDDRRVADALAGLLAELAKVPDPPRPVLRAVVRWFGEKASVFADELVRAAGKTAGVGSAIGAGAVATGAARHVPDLVAALGRVAAAVGP